jgi:predicted phosphodiesterase
MCRTFQVPRHYLTEYIKIHGWTHDSEPMSDEVLLAEPIDALVEDVLMQKKHQLAVAYERKQWEEVERDAEKWRNFERTLLQELQKSISKSPSPARIRLKPVDPFALVMAPQDFHWGGYAWKDETGEAYSRKEAEQRILSKTTEIVSLLPGRPEKIYLSVGGDWFHIDGDHATTTKGTPQEIEGSPSEIFITGCEMALHHVEVLRQVAPVELVFMGGNHDRANSLALMMYLQAWYRNTADVIVHRTSQLRTYLEYQQVLMGFTHGDKVKPKDLGVVMATEAREAWGRTTSHIWFTGHLHHEVVREVGGIVQYQLPSLAGTDRWHARQGYTAARAGLCGHLVNRKGVMMSLFAAVEEK